MLGALVEQSQPERCVRSAHGEGLAAGCDGRRPWGWIQVRSDASGLATPKNRSIFSTWVSSSSAAAVIPLRRTPVLQYSKICYNFRMPDRSSVLCEVMLTTSTTQSELSRLSGVRQPSISQFLSGRGHLSDEQLDRLLSCMGYRLEVVRRQVRPELTRSEWRSWRLHRQLSTHLTRASLERWRPTIERNLERLRSTVRGQPHVRNLDRWESLLDHGDVPGLHRILTGLDRDSIEMREVSPLGGLLPNEERLEVLRAAG